MAEPFFHKEPEKMSGNDQIDLQKMTQRELLIVMHDRLNGIAESVKTLTETQAKHEVRISLIEQRVVLLGTIFGLIGAALVEIAISFFK